MKQNPKIGFSDVTKLLTLKFGYFSHCGSALTLLTRRYHKNWGSMMSHQREEKLLQLVL
jgi:hypothetical protein